MDFTLPPDDQDLRLAIRELCAQYPGEYWRSLEPDKYPEEFVQHLTEQGWLSALIPEDYGGAGLTLTAASIILEEINASGCNASACHAQMYTMGTILRHGTPEQKTRIPAGHRRRQLPSPSIRSHRTSCRLRHDQHSHRRDAR